MGTGVPGCPSHLPHESEIPGRTGAACALLIFVAAPTLLTGGLGYRWGIRSLGPWRKDGVGEEVGRSPCSDSETYYSSGRTNGHTPTTVVAERTQFLDKRIWVISWLSLHRNSFNFLKLWLLHLQKMLILQGYCVGERTWFFWGGGNM